MRKSAGFFIGFSQDRKALISVRDSGSPISEIRSPRDESVHRSWLIELNSKAGGRWRRRRLPFLDQGGLPGFRQSGICVQKQHEVSCGGLCALMHLRAATRCSGDNKFVGKTLGYRRSLVRAEGINNNDFDCRRRCRAAQMINCSCEVRFFVAGGNDDGDFHGRWQKSN